jgi:hypothetical protein
MKKIIISNVSPEDLIDIINSIKLVGNMYVEAKSTYDAVDKSKLKSISSKKVADISISDEDVPTKPIKFMDEAEVKLLVDKRVEELLNEIVLGTPKEEKPEVVDYSKKSLELLNNSKVDWNNPFSVVKLSYSFMGALSSIRSIGSSSKSDEELIFRLINTSVIEMDNMGELLNSETYNIIKSITTPEHWYYLAKRYYDNFDIKNHLSYYVSGEYTELIKLMFTENND